MLTCISQFVFIAILLSNRAGHVSLTVCNLVMICLIILAYHYIQNNVQTQYHTDQGNRSNREKHTLIINFTQISSLLVTRRTRELRKSHSNITTNLQLCSNYNVTWVPELNIMLKKNLLSSLVRWHQVPQHVIVLYS